MKNLKKTSLYLTLGLFVISILAIVVSNVYYYKHTYPHTRVGSVNISNLNKEQAISKLQNNFEKPGQIMISIDNNLEIIETSQIDLEYDFRKTVDLVFDKQIENNLISNTANIIKYQFFSDLNTVSPQKVLLSLNTDALNESIAIIANTSIKSAQLPSARLVGQKVEINPGTPGREVEVSEISKEVVDNLALGVNETKVETKLVDPTISGQQLAEFQDLANQYIGKSMILTADNFEYTLTDSDLLELLTYPEVLNKESINLLTAKMNTEVTRSPQNPIFNIQNGKVTEFQPSLDGLKLEEEKFEKLIISSLDNLKSSEDKQLTLALPVIATSPEYSISDVNDLGIHTLLARGTSKFSGSSNDRMFNINLGASKFDGVLIKPGEVFSFNNTIGDISVYTGYRQSYVIQNGSTVLGDGGGVCQVSTTLFRAALEAGLPIVYRRSHSYRVSYYEQDIGAPGLDATIYHPTTDFKFENDTPGHLLIQTKYNPQNATLAFEIYGTDDGREVTITKPVITSSSPPPEDLYIDDPNLPAGTIKQIDYAAWGAKSQFDYKVTRDGEVLQERTFYSTYQPWQAKYLKGVGPAS